MEAEDGAEDRPTVSGFRVTRSERPAVRARASSLLKIRYLRALHAANVQRTTCGISCDVHISVRHPSRVHFKMLMRSTVVLAGENRRAHDVL